MWEATKPFRLCPYPIYSEYIGLKIFFGKKRENMIGEESSNNSSSFFQICKKKKFIKNHRLATTVPNDSFGL